MTRFNQHPYDQGINYLEHWGFAMGIAWRLFRSALAFAIHALMPWIPIERKFDLEATSAYLLERNDFIETSANRPANDGHPITV